MSMQIANTHSRAITINVFNLYYYSFLATFAVIIFANLLPSDLIILTRQFVVFTSFLSLVLFNNIKGILYILLLYIFVSIYTLYPLVMDNPDMSVVLNNTKYLMYFVFIFGLINILEYIFLDRLLYSMSQIFVLKLVLVSIISINMNSGMEFFSGYIFNGIDLIVHNLFGVYRVFDVYLFLFPLIFIYAKNKKTITKIIVHVLLFYSIVSSFTFGIIFTYMIIMVLRYKVFKIFLFLVVLVSTILYSDYLWSLYNSILEEKHISIEVKVNQFLFLFDNISLFGQGLGTFINIEGRVDSMLENAYIYWITIYGIIGSIFMISFFIIFPFIICYKYKDQFEIVVLFYMHLSILCVSATNPFLESVIGIIPMIIIVAYFFSKKDMQLGINKWS